MENKKKKTHRHDWEIVENDCVHCGYEIFEECIECGEVRDIPQKKLKKTKK